MAAPHRHIQDAAARARISMEGLFSADGQQLKEQVLSAPMPNVVERDPFGGSEAAFDTWLERQFPGLRSKKGY